MNTRAAKRWCVNAVSLGQAPLRYFSGEAQAADTIGRTLRHACVVRYDSRALKDTSWRQRDLSESHNHH